MVTFYSEEMIKRAREFTEKHIIPIARQLDEENRCPKELFHLMQEEGFFKIHYPKEYGGYGMDYNTSFNVLREIAKGSAGVSLLYVVHFMAVDILLKYGSKAQKDKYLRDLVEGKKIAAYSISEAVAGSDVAGIKTVAEKVEGGYKLKGSKYFVTNGSIANLYFVACKTSPESGAKGISMFIIEKDTPGVDISHYSEKAGFRSSATTNLILKDCIVPEENLLGEKDRGFMIVLDGLVGGRLGMAAIGIGIGEAAFEEAVKFANRRMAFDKPISKLYSIQEKIADMHVKLESARQLFIKACDARDEGKDYSLEASVAKVFIGEAINEICYEAMQILGGHGYMKSNHLERYYRDARLISIGVGTNEVINMVIGNTILGKFNR